MKPLEVFALDRKMNRATLSIPYKSLEWHRCYYECGDFTLEVPADMYDPSWSFIYTDERPETGIIESVSYTDDPKYGNVDTVTLKGRFLESIMNRRTFLDETPEEVTYRYYVSPPSPPRRAIESPTVYKDESGKYWYETPSGTTYGVADGTPSSSDARTPGGAVQTDESGQKYIETGSGRVNVSEQNYIEQGNSYYYTDGSETTVNRVQNFGTELVTTNNKIAFDDGFGNVFYHDANTGSLKLATGVSKKESDNYVIQKRKWASTTDDGWVTVTKTVKGPWQLTGTFDPITPMDNVAMCVQWAQMYFQNDLIFEEPDIEGTVKAVDPSFQLLGDLLYSELQTVGASFRVEFDFINAAFYFSVWRGADRTQGQSVYPWAVFSDTWGSLYGYEAMRDESSYCNKCYVLYEYDEPTSWQSNGAPGYVAVYSENDDGSRGDQTGWRVPYTTKRGFETVRIDDGLDDRETYLDLRKEPPACDSEWEREYSGTEIPDLPAGIKNQYDNFIPSIRSQGMQKLTNECAVQKSLDTGQLDVSGYLRDFDLGDKVDQMVSKIGLVETARITEVSEVYDDGGPSIKITLSESELEEV